MSADVTVRIKAQNDTRTGFQEALNDAKSFGKQASGAMSASGPDGGGLRKVLKGLGTDLAQASTPAEAFQAVATRVASAFGKVTAVVGGFAIGQVIAGQFQKLSEGVGSSTKSLQEFSANYESVANATSMDQAISGFDRLQGSIEAAKSNLSALKSDFGAMIANAAMGGMAFREMEAAIKSMTVASASALSGSSALQLNQAQQQVGAFQSGGNDAVRALALQQQREREIAALEQRKGTDPQANFLIENAIDDARARFVQEDKLRFLTTASSAQQRTADIDRQTAQIGMTPQERLAQERANQTRLQGEVVGASQGAESMLEISARVAELNAEIAKSKQVQAQLEKQIADEAERNAKAQAAAQRSALASTQSQAMANRRATMTPQEQLDFEMQGLADLEGFVGPEVEAQKEAAIGRIMALQQQIQGQGQGALVGSMGASSLQRIGFASNEFFDTRRREDPNKETKRAADAAKQIYELLKKGEPLVLPASS